MPGDVVDWLEALFADLSVRSPHGIGWSLESAEPPTRLRVSLASGPHFELEVRDDGPLARIAIAQQVQHHVDTGWAAPLPPCPDHGTQLVPSRDGNEVRWRCPHGDVDCAVGHYDELLWPPRPEDHAGKLLGRRWSRRGISGVLQWGVDEGVVQAKVHEGTDERAVRAAAAPLAVELEWVPAVGWSRHPSPQGETLKITNAFSHLARLEGPLQRSPSGGLHVGGTAVRLSFEHHVGPHGSPLLLDADGVAFADEGDHVVCGGGLARSGPVRDAQRVFMVGKITRLASTARGSQGGDKNAP